MNIKLICGQCLFQEKLTAVMETLTMVAMQKICRLFSYCIALKQAQMKRNNNVFLNLKSLEEENLSTPEENKHAQSASGLSGKTFSISLSLSPPLRLHFIEYYYVRVSFCLVHCCSEVVKFIALPRFCR